MISKLRFFGLVVLFFVALRWGLVFALDIPREIGFMDSRYSHNTIVWTIFKAISLLLWGSFFGYKVIENIKKSSNKWLLIGLAIFAMVGTYFMIMFIDIPFKLVSCIANRNPYSCYSIRLSAGVDCRGLGRAIRSPLLRLLDPFEMRILIFGTHCVF
ncbi:MAG: hypothetical protein ABH867_02550 [Patescibacteria group bacterium]|nr:hypothetical protein [Patescibacteria group bacterium]